jgi:hypothetical protein
MKNLLATVAFGAVLSSLAIDDGMEKMQFKFASVAEGQKVLSKRDDFVERLSAFDRAGRLKTDQRVSEEQFLEFVTNNVVAFTPQELSLVGGALKDLKPKLARFSLSWPQSILLIKTTGKEEGDAAYTRGTAIIIPQSKLSDDAKAIESLLCHEMFHVLSRNDATLKEKLYATIGFQKCNEVEFPTHLVRITNPDAPKNDHWIKVKSAGKDVMVVPILFANPSQYDTRNGGEFFRYLKFKLLVVTPAGANKVEYDTKNATLLDVNGVDGFFQQVGQNTGYIIHPEEILADNFVLVANATKEVPSPDVLVKLAEALASTQR